jgi:hypothetical protein
VSVRRPERASLRIALALSLAAASLVLVPARAVGPFRTPCDPLDPALCLLPFPNDRFTRADPTTDTGRRIDFQLAEMPRSIAGKSIDPTEWNRNDGFSPGSMVLTFVPGLDLHRTWGTQSMKGARVGGPNDPRDHLAAIDRYAAPNAPILIIDATTGRRWPFWSELDTNAATGDDERMLILRPAVNFLEGHRYLVALRNMRDATGNVIPAGPQFASYRDRTAAPPTELTFEEDRRPEVESIINGIARAETRRGNRFDRKQLYLAWQFTIASERNLSERVLHIRDDAFAQLGDRNLADRRVAGRAPAFEVTTVTDRSADGARLRQVEGTITVPNYLTLPPLPPVEEIPFPVPVDNPIGDSLPGQAIPGGRFLYGPDDLPMQNPVMPTIDVPFVCTVPKAATASPAHPMLYGHGLLGSRFESTGGSTDRGRERNFMPCAVNWMGFAEYDVLNAFTALVDPSNAPSLMDRAQQGFLNFLYLGRALTHPKGLVTNAAFQASGKPLFRTGELFYDGNSQGAIMGGALTALGVDFTRSVLGVPGMNYSTLLNRSVDWEGPIFNPEDPDLPSYSSFTYTMFPDKREQQILGALLQMIWDRAEGNGYAQHMTTDPLRNTPAHQVLLHVALGDFQVTNHAAEVESRTIGASVMQTALARGRHWAIRPYFGLSSFRRTRSGAIIPWRGSALVYWDSGNLLPPNGNRPPLEDGGDPHEDPRRDPRAADQKVAFWLTGKIFDVMSGGPYLLCRPGIEKDIPRVPSLFGGADWCR